MMPWNWLMSKLFHGKRTEAIANKLERAYVKKLEDRAKLKTDIEEHVKLALSGRKRSDYIPPKLKREVLDMVYQKYGEEMREVDLFLKPNLEWNQ